MPSKELKQRAAEVLARLARRYPHPEPALAHSSPWELLVATVLSAQCTDERVNKVTPGLFRRWPGPAELLAAPVEEIEEVVRSTGFFRNKARNLKAAARVLVEDHGGSVPRTMEELTALPGVARKTANIVLSNAFGVQEGIAVDTHVTRLAYRLGFTQSGNPQLIEKDLLPLFPRASWGDVNHYLVFLGREVCTARKPRCPECDLEDICPRHGVKA